MSKANKLLLLYYVGMLLLMVSWTNTEQAPNIIIRCVFLLAVILPAVSVDKSFLAPSVICFMTISQNGFAHSYMPEKLLFYVVALLICLIFFRPAKNRAKIPVSLWILFIFVTFIDLITSSSIERVSYTFFVSVLLLAFTTSKSNKDITLWALCFVSASLVLSGLFLINRERFAESYYAAGIERTSWMDPNYFGIVIGMGCVVALQRLLFKRDDETSNNNLLLKTIYIVTIFVALLTLVLNASRGALLATGVSALFIILFTKGQFTYKLLSTVLIVVGLVFIYQNSYFDLLLYRMENDNSEGGNGRYIIWANKLGAFFGGDISSIIMGYGYEGGLDLGFVGRRGTHSDFVGFLIEYGVVGFILFMIMLIKPILVSLKNKNTITVAALLLYLIICCFNIEPITGGYIPDLFFYFYILLLAGTTTGGVMQGVKYSH